MLVPTHDKDIGGSGQNFFTGGSGCVKFITKKADKKRKKQKKSHKKATNKGYIPGLSSAKVHLNQSVPGNQSIKQVVSVSKQRVGET